MYSLCSILFDLTFQTPGPVLVINLLRKSIFLQKRMRRVLEGGERAWQRPIRPIAATKATRKLILIWTCVQITVKENTQELLSTLVNLNAYNWNEMRFRLN